MLCTQDLCRRARQAQKQADLILSSGEKTATTNPDDPLDGHDPHFELRGGNKLGYESHDDEQLLAGPAGTGKSLTNLLRCYHTARDYPGARILIVRKTRESLTESVLVTWERDILGPTHPVLTRRPVIRRVRQSYTFPNRSEVVIGGIDKPGKILSSEYDLIYCFPGDTLVESPTMIERGFKRAYSGPLVTIRTALGNQLTGTPNHPILTDEGWVALGEIQEGDHVVSRLLGKKVAVAHPNVNHGPAPLAKLVRSFAETTGTFASTERVTGSDMDFHGDGSGGSVDVITARRKFGNRLNPTLCEPSDKHGVRGAGFDLLGLECFRSADEVVLALGGPANLRMADFRELLVEVGVPLHSCGLTFRDGEVFQVSPSHCGLERGVADTDAFRNGDQRAFPFKVAFDRVVHVGVAHLDSRNVRHVYNLRTEGRYYLANNIVAHNCPESTDLTVEDWETLGGRLRAARVPFQQIIADCNPTTPHHWLYKRFQAGSLRLIPTTHKDNPRYWDGTDWTPLGKQYLARLGRMTGTRRDRFLLGNWVAAEGVVYAFDPDVHQLESSWEPPRLWTRVWGIDWGKSSPTALGLFAIDPQGRMYHYREVYQTHLRADKLGEWAKAEIDSGREPVPHGVVCDHDLDAKADFERMSKLVLNMAEKADRKEGIQAMQERFDVQDDGKPRIYFKMNALAHEPDRGLVESGKPTCAIEEVVAYTWDEDFLKDEPIEDGDHAMDYFRYVTRYANTNFPGPHSTALGESYSKAKPVAAGIDRITRLPKGLFK